MAIYKSRRLVAEHLECRSVPATHTWTGLGGGSLWSDPANWAGNDAPEVGEADCVVRFTNGGSSNQNIQGLTVERIEIANSPATISLAKNLTIDAAGSAINLQVTATGTSQIAGPGDLNVAGSDLLTQVSPGGTLDIATEISGGFGLATDGAGTTRLTGQNTYLGDTRVRAGTLELNAISNTDVFKSATVFVGNGVGSSASARLRLLKDLQLADATNVVVESDGKFDLNGNVETINDLRLTGGASVATGADMLNLDGDLHFTGGGDAAVVTGIVALSAGSHDFVIADGAAARDLQFNAKLVGAGGFIKRGVGTMSIGGTVANTFTGPTIVAEGTLILDNDALNGAVPNAFVVGDKIGAQGSAKVVLDQNAEIPSTANVLVHGDGLLDLDGHTQTLASLGLDGGAVVDSNGGTLFLSKGVFVGSGVTPATITGTLALPAGDHVLNATAGTRLKITAVVAGSGDIVNVGAGVAEFASASAHTGTGTIRVASGVVELNSVGGHASADFEVGNGGGAAGSAVLRFLRSDQIADGSTVATKIDGRFDLAGKNDTVGPLSLGGGSITTGTGTLRLNSAVSVSGGVTTTITGKLNLGTNSRTINVPSGSTLNVAAAISATSPTAGLIKQSAGTLRLSGANTYTGTTQLKSGILEVNGASGASDVHLTGGRLRGTGTVGKVTATAGLIDPGTAATGILRTKGADLGGTTLVIQANGPVLGTGFDQLGVMGGVDLAGAALDIDINFATAKNSVITVIQNDGNDAVVGTFAGLAQNATFVQNGRTYRISYTGGSGNDVTLTDVTL